MPKTLIIAKSTLGQPITFRASGYAEYSGSFMGVPTVTFRQICSPSPISWTVGDRCRFSKVGQEIFKLYSIPNMIKRSVSNTAGDAFIYENVQFFAATKDLELTPWRDFVLRDNNIHFSSRESATTFENVSGIKNRLQAIMDEAYPGIWTFNIATPTGTPESDITEAKEITIHGSVMDGLKAICDNWKGVVWKHTAVIPPYPIYIGDDITHVITIGFPEDVCPLTSEFQFGKGNGLMSIRRTVDDVDSIVTQIFPFGSERNLPDRYYNGKAIVNAESVDIPNLMLPPNAVRSLSWGGWGKSVDPSTQETLPDPAKALINDTAAITFLGLRPKRMYFDGSDGNDDIYPTLQGVTIGEVKSGNPLSQYRPKSSIWTSDSARVDEVMAVIGGDDTGDVSQDGTDYTRSVSASHEGESVEYFVTAEYPEFIADSITLSGTSNSVKMTCTRKFHLSGQSGQDLFFTDYGIRLYDSNGDLIRTREITLWDEADTDIDDLSVTTNVNVKMVELYLKFFARGASASNPVYCTFTDDAGKTTVYEKAPVLKTFQMRIPQIGFDINEQASLGSGITVAMKDGQCAGREFEVKACEYELATDTWLLTLNRQEDTSLNTLFPNNRGYLIEPGDHFVLLDIAMPEMYVTIAEQRLLVAARKKLAEISHETLQFEPEIDPIYMNANSPTLREGMRFNASDNDLSEINGVLIDSLTITDGAASDLANYKVVLRNTKRKGFWDTIDAIQAQASKGYGRLDKASVESQKQIRRILNENV